MRSPDSPPPPRRYTSPTGRVVIPILVVVLVIVVLGRPILVTGLDLGDDPPDRPGRERQVKLDEPKGPSRLAVPYPKACLRPADSPGRGLIAASQGNSIGLSTPDGRPAFALRAKPPVGFSAGGTFVAIAGADLWTNEGEHVGLAFSRPLNEWAWSPTGDCIAGIDRERLVVAEPGERAHVLVRDVRVSNFAFSPDGTRIVFTVGGKTRATGVWMADLEMRDVKPLQSSVGWTLTAWSRAGRPILLRAGTTEDEPSKKDLSFVPSDEVAYCGDEAIVVQRERLATFGLGGVPSYVRADRRFRYTAVACSPGGDLMAVVRYPKGDPTETSLAVLQPDGDFVRDIARGSTREDQPMWGPARTGVVFVGDVSGEGAAGPLVWFVPEGGEARPTGLRVSGSSELDSTLDWSATPPLGHPTD